MRHVQRFGLPLLAKELLELSAKKRTYIIRIVYAAILLITCCGILFSVIPASMTPTSALGIGWHVVVWMAYLQRMGLYLVLPVLASGAFTAEKERNTLGLLLLTQLRPWTIVIEKFLSYLALALSFLIISLPLMGFTYSLGGITIDELAAYSYGLLITSIKIIAVCLLCSAYCRTTLGALLSSYVVMYSLGILTSMVTILISVVAGAGLPRASVSILDLISRFPIWTLFIDRPPLGLMGRAPPGSTSWVVRSMLYSLPTLGYCIVCLVLARRFLVSRAFATPSQRLKVLFQKLDQFFQRTNQNRWTRGIVLTRHDRRVPDNNPVAWRETNTRSLGQTRYLVRWLCCIEIPVLIVLMLSSISIYNDTLESVAWLMLIGLWIVMGLVTCASAASLMTRERRQQTLDVLLATPLYGFEIVQQKMAGLRRLIWVCQIPMWTCLLTYVAADPAGPMEDLEFILSQASMMLIYPWLIAWIAMWHGLRSRTAVAAILKTIVSCAVRCVVPVVVVLVAVFCLWYLTRFSQSYGELVVKVIALPLLFSPGTLFFFCGPGFHSAESEYLYLSGFPMGWAYNAAIHGTVLQMLKRKCLAKADTLLGRSGLYEEVS